MYILVKSKALYIISGYQKVPDMIYTKVIILWVICLFYSHIFLLKKDEITLHTQDTVYSQK